MEPKEGIFNFQVESRLLEELGERLVSKPEIAISELIKNAYDAEADECITEIKSESIVILDNGHGMTLDSFKNRWMRIATRKKTSEHESPKYHRLLTGAKGVGRFAVRLLGDHLRVITVAYDPKLKVKTKLTAIFHWKELDKTDNLENAKIPYTLEYPIEDELGTTLEISKLKFEFKGKSLEKIRTAVLSIANPITSLQPLAEVRDRIGLPTFSMEDPGFQISFSGDDIIHGEDLSEKVMGNYVAKATLEFSKGDNISSTIYFDSGEKFEVKENIKNVLGSPVYAEIRFFPRRSGVFANKGFRGTEAWKWVRDFHGVKVFDKGFRISPYGEGTNDWLALDSDTAHSTRQWKSSLAKKLWPIGAHEIEPSLNPALNIPTNYQIVGAVFLNSPSLDKNSNQKLLIPSMDRQGFMENEAFESLKDVVRFLAEFIAKKDRDIRLKIAEVEREEFRNTAKKRLMLAIDTIEKSKSISPVDKTSLVKEYKRLSNNLEELESYDRRSREKIQVMGLLGIMAGFMTHEHQKILWQLDESSNALKLLAKKDPSFQGAYEAVQGSIEKISGYVDYTKLYIKSLNQPVRNDLMARPRLEHAIEAHQHFIESKQIEVSINCEDDILMPVVPISMYEGVVLNLFTNALKAIIANPKNIQGHIDIASWVDQKFHYVRVSDNGLGIPEELKERIWDPLFTTTSDDNSPLGSGMGLGLPLVKGVIDSIKGSIETVTAPPPFSTCFEIKLPRKTPYGSN